MAKSYIVNGHIVMSYYVGIVEYWVDGKTCWSMETAARWCGVTPEELWEALSR